jgi:hypothetical protein
MKPFIAKDTKQPLVVFGGYRIAEGGGIIHDSIQQRKPGVDYGADPVGDGTFKMVPSGDIVGLEERIRRLQA